MTTSPIEISFIIVGYFEVNKERKEKKKKKKRKENR